MAKLGGFADTLQAISDRYEQVKAFLAACPGAQLSFNDLQNSQLDFTALAHELQNNATIRKLMQKMGRAYVDEEIKKSHKVPKTSTDETHGTHLSGDLMRLLPSELVLLEDEDLEALFYARLLERNL